MSLRLPMMYRGALNNVVRNRGLASEIQKTNKPLEPAVQSSQTPQDSTRLSSARKRMFVLAGIYKSMKDVPDVVTRSTLSRNMDKFRVRASILIMVLSACGALSSIMLAKNVVEEIEGERDGRK